MTSAGPSAVFRCDGGAGYGLGHVTRCLALAYSLKGHGWHCVFAIQSDLIPTFPTLSKSGFEIWPLRKIGDIGEMIEHAADGYELLVVDHPKLDGSFEKSCRAWARRIMVIDDMPTREHDCDLLLDQTFGRQPDAYAGRVPGSARILAGADFVLLHPKFAELRDGALERRRAKDAGQNLLVSFGAIDGRGMTLLTLDAIQATGSADRVDIVIGGMSPTLDVLKKRQDELDMESTLHIDLDTLAPLMAIADIAIGAGGVTAWERACMGLPTVMVTVADNQRDVAAAFEQSRTAKVLGWWKDVTPGHIGDALTDIAEDDERRRDMSIAAAELCDGRGAERAALELIGA